MMVAGSKISADALVRTPEKDAGSVSAMAGRVEVVKSYLRKLVSRDLRTRVLSSVSNVIEERRGKFKAEMHRAACSHGTGCRGFNFEMQHRFHATQAPV
jgi:hypothetical protein